MANPTLKPEPGIGFDPHLLTAIIGKVCEALPHDAVFPVFTEAVCTIYMTVYRLARDNGGTLDHDVKLSFLKMEAGHVQ